MTALRAGVCKIRGDATAVLRMPHMKSELTIGQEAIGRLSGRSRWAAARWIRDHTLPAARMPDGQWFTTVGSIESWILERRKNDPMIKG